MKDCFLLRTLRHPIAVLCLFLSPLSSFAAPGNDLCASATLLTSGPTCVNTAGTVVAATYTSAGAPAPCSGTVTYDVWYSFVAQTTNPTITMSSVGASFLSPNIQLLSGTCGSFSSLGCNASSIAASGLTPGTTYYIRVYSISGSAPASAGGFNICVTDPVPANDLCAGAISISSSSSCVNTVGSVASTTYTSAGAPAPCSGTVKYDVWYSFVAQVTNPTITLSSVGANFASANIQLLSGTCGSFSSLGCSTTSINATGLTVGTTYYIRVYSLGAAVAPTTSGWFSLCVVNPAPANDLCAGAIS